MMNASVTRAMTSSRLRRLVQARFLRRASLLASAGAGVETKDTAIPEKRIREMSRIDFDRSQADHLIRSDSNAGASVYNGKLAGRATRKKLIGRSAGDFGKRLAARSTCLLSGGGDIESAGFQGRTFVQGDGDTIVQVSGWIELDLPCPAPPNGRSRATAIGWRRTLFLKRFLGRAHFVIVLEV